MQVPDYCVLDFIKEVFFCDDNRSITFSSSSLSWTLVATCAILRPPLRRGKNLPMVWLHRNIFSVLLHSKTPFFSIFPPKVARSCSAYLFSKQQDLKSHKARSCEIKGLREMERSSILSTSLGWKVWRRWLRRVLKNVLGWIPCYVTAWKITKIASKRSRYSELWLSMPWLIDFSIRDMPKLPPIICWTPTFLNIPKKGKYYSTAIRPEPS